MRAGTARRFGRLARPAGLGAGRRPPRRGRSGGSAHPGRVRSPGAPPGARAWLAARGDDREREKTALEEWIALEPAEAAPLERLADLAAEGGDPPERLADLRRRKAALDAARERYRALMSEPVLAPRAAELARAAEDLGRTFDARAWWALAARRDYPKAAEARIALGRLAGTEPKAEPDGRTLADLLAPLRPSGAGKNPASGALKFPSFADEAERRGVAFRFDNGRSDLHQLPETMSGGVGLLDFDNDGRLDIYAVQGGVFPPRVDAAPWETGSSATSAMGVRGRHRLLRPGRAAGGLWAWGRRRRLRQ